jgi:hypothetical protein
MEPKRMDACRFHSPIKGTSKVSDIMRENRIER